MRHLVGEGGRPGLKPGWTTTKVFMDGQGLQCSWTWTKVFMDMYYSLQEWTRTIVFTDIDLRDKDKSLHKQGL